MTNDKYHWANRGDLNAFFGLIIDNVAVLVLLVVLVSGEHHFTPEFVITKLVPGTALGVLLGDLVYTWMAFRLAKATGRTDVTAMPLGLDTPSTFGVAFLVLLPARSYANSITSDPERAMEWYKSAQYQEALAIRLKAATSEVSLLTGHDG